MFAYDRVPYQSYPITLTHPPRVAALAAVFGLEPAPVERWRVLEIGCGNGANLIAMAYALPDARFVGVDLAEAPIRAAREHGLRNCEFHARDLAALTPEFGEFDYIIAHGVYSWVPAPVRDRLLEVCRANLAPQGVAYVSYNTYPGCHLRAMTREMMLYHTRGIEDPERKMEVARELLGFLAATPNEALRAEVRTVETRETSVFFHDDLAEINAPLYFHQFIEHAQRHRLQFLAEAQFSSMQGKVEQYPELDRIGVQQYLDFLKCRRFRQTLLCRAELALRESPESVRRLYVASPAKPEGEDGFRTADGAAIRTGHPQARAVFECLIRAWPRAVAFGELPPCDPGFLLAIFAAGLVELQAAPPPFTTEVSERPRAFALARQAESATIPTLRHSTVEIHDELARRLIGLLDGTRDRAALIAELQPYAPAPIDTETLEGNLQALARLALLEG